MLRQITFAATFLLTLATTAIAAPAIVGQTITGPSSIELRSGLTLPVPAGWRAGAAADGVSMSMVGPDGNSTIIGTIQPIAANAIKGYLGAPIDMGGGLILTPTTEVGQAQDYYFADYAVRGASLPAQATILAQPLAGNKALALVGIVPAGTLEETRPILQQMLAASVLTEPSPQSASSPEAGGADDWSTYLRGRYLVRIYNGNGYFEKHDLWLCSNGEFASADEGGGFTVGVASGAFGSNHGGTWSATGKTGSTGTISFVSSDGTQGQIQVAMGADGIYLNGERWMRGENTQCR